jgi:hypothetical protein
MCVFGDQILSTGESGFFKIMTFMCQKHCQYMSAILQNNDNLLFVMSRSDYIKKFVHFLGLVLVFDR